MTALDIAPIPVKDKVVNPPAYQNDANAWLCSTAWNEFFTRTQVVLESCPRLISSVQLTSQGAAITATDFSGGALAAGFYEVKYYIRITRAAGTSSSVQLTLGWTDGAVAQSHTFTAITGNATTTVQSDVKPLKVDKSSPITYAIAYSTVGSPTALYSLHVHLVKIPAPAVTE